MSNFTPVYDSLSLLLLLSGANRVTPFLFDPALRSFSILVATPSLIRKQKSRNGVQNGRGVCPHPHLAERAPYTALVLQRTEEARVLACVSLACARRSSSTFCWSRRSWRRSSMPAISWSQCSWTHAWRPLLETCLLAQCLMPPSLALRLLGACLRATLLLNPRLPLRRGAHAAGHGMRRVVQRQQCNCAAAQEVPR